MHPSLDGYEGTPHPQFGSITEIHDKNLGRNGRIWVTLGFWKNIK